MRVLRSVAAIGAIGALIICAASFSYAAETTMERPFGGPPPPKTRKIERAMGTTCATPTITCELSKAQPVGTACTCAGSDGKPVKGKVAGSP